MILLTALGGSVAGAQNCDFKDYKAQDGLTAETQAGFLQVSWQGERGQQLRAAFAIRDGQPEVRELAARKGQGAWIVLGRGLVPEFEVTSGMRRMSEQQAAPLRALKIEITPEVIDRKSVV